METVDLLEDITDKIISVEEQEVDEKTAIHRYTLSDGTIYEVPFKKEVDLQEIFTSLLEKPKIQIAQDEYGIEKMCKAMIERMRNHLVLKELYRYLKTCDKLEGQSSEYLNPFVSVLEVSSKYINYNSKVAAKLAPLWFRRDVPGLPHYNGRNPYNIFGVDHKYDYLLKPDQKYFSDYRNLILIIAKNFEPFIPSEEFVYASSDYANIAEAKITNGPIIQ